MKSFKVTAAQDGKHVVKASSEPSMKPCSARFRRMLFVTSWSRKASRR